MENLLSRYPSLEICKKDIENALMLILDTYKNGGKVLVCGNGGSAADSEHPEMMYAQLVYGYAGKNDLVIGLSTSGNSKNVVNAMEVAKCMDAKTLALTGEKESHLSEICDVTVRVPETETYKVQELHLPIYNSSIIITLLLMNN